MHAFRLSAAVVLVFVAISPILLQADDSVPFSTDPRLKIELYAESPLIVTPTGIDVDEAGRVWAIESNTHFPPEGYDGHPSDRILVMQGQDANGQAEQITVFKDGLTHSMSIAVKPAWLNVQRIFEPEKNYDGKPEDTPQIGRAFVPESKRIEVFIATRREISLCTDTDGDLKCDEVKRLVYLETTGNYPHNGLAGFAFDALGNMFFGFGENLGADYRIIGSDGTTLSGGGEGGNIYRCRPDGTKLERWATGFWNPHASCIDGLGRMFTLDNDPDSRPPCRLLHIIAGGDYGYRFRYGRKGTHPFSSWNGEIPGTLPMVSGTGEAPSGIVCYEASGFPKDYLGTLLVGSWGDHRIDKFVLKPRGASFESMPQPVIKGGENFRPVGLAVAPDGSLFVTDWVSKEYKLHGKGRIWRVSAKEQASSAPVKSVAMPNENSLKDLIAALKNDRISVRRYAARCIEAKDQGHEKLFPTVYGPSDLSLKARYEVLCARPAMRGSELGAISGEDLESLDAVFAAYLRLVESQYGILTYEVIHYEMPAVRWIDQFWWQDSVVDPSVWLELGRFERIHEGYIPNCTVNEEYYESVPKYLNAIDPFMLAVLIESAAKESEVEYRRMELRWNDEFASEGMRLLTVLAARRRSPAPQRILRLGLSDPSPKVRRAAVQWAAEDKLIGFRPQVEKVLASEPMTTDLFLACLASLSMLDGVPPAEFEKTPPAQYLLAIIQDVARPATLRATALRMLPATQKELDAKLLGEMLTSADLGLRREAVRTLQYSTIPERDTLLRVVADDRAADESLRADAVAALACVDHHAKQDAATQDLLLKLATTPTAPVLQLEAVRSLRLEAAMNSEKKDGNPKVRDALTSLSSDTSKQSATSRGELAESLNLALGRRVPRTAAELLADYPAADLTNQPSVDQPISNGDAEAGRRAFFHVNGAGCYKCHAVSGRGGQVGPDLTVIARTMDRRKLAESIVDPSKEISPQFTSWSIETTSGKVVTGLLLGEELNGDLKLGNNKGEVVFVPFKEIESRTPMKTSIMPEKLHESMTSAEFRDLIAYLATLK